MPIFSYLKKHTKTNNFDRNIQITKAVLSRHSDVPESTIDFFIECIQKKNQMEYAYNNRKAIDKTKEIYYEGIVDLKDNDEYDFYNTQIQMTKGILSRLDVPDTIISYLIESIQKKSDSILI